ncbi:hypothetical protein AVEN_102460-1 [Araneus ventricosus]|uniref:Uncharacterized protein n=1 Tax=Araneus ventricosus TaxID=182803 RepID=A0A4Y2KYT6_ARAVE|nr:hypothetical protein AVEN_102460-1 [Araneus ventricosus]
MMPCPLGITPGATPDDRERFGQLHRSSHCRLQSPRLQFGLERHFQQHPGLSLELIQFYALLNVSFTAAPLKPQTQAQIRTSDPFLHLLPPAFKMRTSSCSDFL